MLVHVGLKTLEPVNGVLWLAIGQIPDNINHKNSVSAVGQSRAQRERLSGKVVHSVRICLACDVVVQKDAFFEEHVHLVVIVASYIVWLLEDIQIMHLFERCV